MKVLPAIVDDSKCSVCGGDKKVKVRWSSSFSHFSPMGDTRSEDFGYAPSENETIIEAYCTNCGLKFHVS